MWHWGTTALCGKPRTYKRNLLIAGGANNCPVEGCRGRAAIQTMMRVHVYHQNVRDTVIILEEGNLPHIWCRRFNMLVP